MPTIAQVSISRSSLTLLGKEPWRAAMEFMSFKINDLMQKSPVRAGDGHPVIIFPGLATDGSGVTPLRDYRKSLGYQAINWGQGYNIGPKSDLEQWLKELASHTANILQSYVQPATLIGWSLGGIYEREMGKLLAPQVRQVINIGTPFNAEADHTNVGWLFRLLSGTPAAIKPEMSKRLRIPPPPPTISIYSRSDDVVSWETCRHTEPDQAANAASCG